MDAETIAQQFITELKRMNPWAFKEYNDRVLGKPQQAVDVRTEAVKRVKVVWNEVEAIDPDTIRYGGR